MNQILLTSNQYNKKKNNKSNSADTKKVIMFFGLVIIIFAIIIIALYGYKLYKNNKEEEIPITKPEIQIEELENNIKIIANSTVGINTITYKWNEEEPQEMQMNGRTSNEESLEIP